MEISSLIKLCPQSKRGRSQVLHSRKKVHGRTRLALTSGQLGGKRISIFGGIRIQFEIEQATLKKKKSEHLMTTGFYELCLENNLRELKVYNEVYFGQDSYVGNSMHKIYKNFLKDN